MQTNSMNLLGVFFLMTTIILVSVAFAFWENDAEPIKG